MHKQYPNSNSYFCGLVAINNGSKSYLGDGQFKFIWCFTLRLDNLRACTEHSHGGTTVNEEVKMFELKCELWGNSLTL